MAVRLFEGEKRASLYLKYRTSPSKELIDTVVTFFKRNSDGACKLAVDVGCGSGQGTILLAPHFTQVLGTDVSPAQLEMAMQNNSAPNITYRECPAEELPVEDASVDLVSAMSAFHWFDHRRFLQEADRVLKPKGCLAVINYTLDMELNYGECSEELNHICHEFYNALSPYKHPHLGSGSFALYEQTYNDLQYPVKEWQPSFWVRHTVPLSKYIGMVRSFSSFETFLEENPEEAETLSQNFTQKLLSTMKVTSTETEVIMGVRYFYFLACKTSAS